MCNAYVSFALGPIVLPAHLSVPSSRRIRELKDGKVNAVSLYMMINSGDKITKEAYVMEMKRLVDSQSRELLGLVLEEKNSVVPKSCKDLFWHMSTVLHMFYSKDDGFTSQELIRVVKAMLYEPVVVLK
ncbi:hypothetical protein OROGR_030276 [Orobanche gracilis]